MAENNNTNINSNTNDKNIKNLNDKNNNKSVTTENDIINNQINAINNLSSRIKRNKSEGDNLQYLKIRLYRDNKFITNFNPKLINQKYNTNIIFPSDFKLDREEINKIINNEKVIDKNDENNLDQDINLVGNLDKNKINKLRFSNSKSSEDTSEIIKKNINYLIHSFFQPYTIINIDGINVQILSARIIDKNEDIHKSIIANMESRLLNEYKRSNQDYYIKYEAGDSTVINDKAEDIETDNNYLNKIENSIFRKENNFESTNDEGLLSGGGYNFHIAIDIKISTDKVLKKSKFKGIISPFASCKTKRAALSEVLDYNINLFETQYLKIDKKTPTLKKKSTTLPPQVKKGGKNTKKRKKKKIKKRLSKSYK